MTELAEAIRLECMFAEFINRPSGDAYDRIGHNRYGRQMRNRFYYILKRKNHGNH